jgi:hypothetical protein
VTTKRKLPNRNSRYRYCVFGDGYKSVYNGRGYWGSKLDNNWWSVSGFIFCKSKAHALRQFARVLGPKPQIQKNREVIKWRTRTDIHYWRIK